MRTLLVLITAVALGLALLGAPSPSAADAPRYVVIVHPDSPLTSISRDALRDAFLKKSLEWNDGVGVRPADLGKRWPVRERFTREVLRKSPAQLRAYWNQRVFSGKGVPPVTLDSTDAMIGFVLRERGGVGYLPAGVDPRGAKIIAVE